MPVDPGADNADIAAYMADMIAELREIAQRSGFATLSSVLEIAHREANWRKSSAR